MRNARNQRTERRRIKLGKGAWALVAGLALLASCATPPKSAPPPAERSEPPVAAAPRHAEPAQPPAPAEAPAAGQRSPQATGASPAPPAPAAPQAPAEVRPLTARTSEATSAQPPEVVISTQQERPPEANPPTSAPAAKDSGGCGDKGDRGDKGALPKPSPTGPQPRFVCNQTKIAAEPVWQGTSAEFVFEIGNEGEGNLAIKIQGG